MTILREQIEADLEVTLEGDFGLPVVLIAPDGAKQTLKKDATTPLLGQIIYDTRIENPETGQEIIVHKPVVTLRRSSLERIPESLEKWVVKIPPVPQYITDEEQMISFSLEDPKEDGGSIGFIRLYLKELDQS
jgi:hypothetical protein